MGKVFFKVVAMRQSDYREAKELLLEEQCGFRPDRSLDHGGGVCGAQAAGNWAEGRECFFMCSIHLQKPHDTVGRTLLWQVLTRIGVPPQIIAVIR